MSTVCRCGPGPHDQREVTLPGGLPGVVVGGGPPLLALTGLTARHEVPRGGERRLALHGLRTVSGAFSVHVLARRPGLLPGTTMHDLAADVARAIEEHVGAPVPVLGTSTGGSVALQLAVDHPHLVERLVLVCSAHRLGEEGRRRQRALADLTRAGRPRRGWAQLAPLLTHGRAAQAAMSAMLWATAPRGTAAELSDMLRTIEAEDAFDVGEELHRVTAPTLVLAGARDGFYGADLFRRTAAGIPRGHLRMDPRGTHMGVSGAAGAQAAALRFLRPPGPPAAAR